MKTSEEENVAWNWFTETQHKSWHIFSHVYISEKLTSIDIKTFEGATEEAICPGTPTKRSLPSEKRKQRKIVMCVHESRRKGSKIWLRFRPVNFSLIQDNKNNGSQALPFFFTTIACVVLREPFYPQHTHIELISLNDFRWRVVHIVMCLIVLVPLVTL